MPTIIGVPVTPVIIEATTIIDSPYYCTVEDVASLTKTWTIDGLYNENTNPRRSEIEAWIKQCSSLVDVALAQEGFTVPIIQPTAIEAIRAMVSAIVADLCNSANGHGRLSSSNIEGGVSPMFIVRKELNDWAVTFASGLEQIGASRGASKQDTIGFSTEDFNGNAVTPIFRRDSFGYKTE